MHSFIEKSKLFKAFGYGVRVEFYRFKNAIIGIEPHKRTRFVGFADFFEMIFHHAAFYVALTVVNAFKVHCVDLFVFVYFYMQAA